MMHYFLEHCLCLLLCLLVYHFLLEKEKMHGFNRYYLLLSVGLSLVLPFVNIPVSGETLPTAAYTTLQSIPSVSAMPDVASIPKVASTLERPGYIYRSMWCVYGSVALVFFYRFARNLLFIKSTVEKHKKIQYGSSRLVLMHGPVSPHSFLHYIFVNEQEYASHKIEKELLMHELVHVYEKHSFDILFMELLLIVFWFNPLLYFYKKAIKLNHEFLADEQVISTYTDVAAYQHLLLHKVYTQHTSPLISTLNYSLTKKRLIMMTKISSPVRMWLKKVAIMPLLLLVITAFSTEMLAQQPAPKKENPAKKEPGKETAKKQPEEMYYGNVTITEARNAYYNNNWFHIIQKNDKGEYVKKYYKDLTAEEIARLPNPPKPPVKQIPSQAQLDDWKNSEKYGIWVDDKQVDNKTLNNYKPADIAKYDVSRLHKNAVNYGKHYFQINLYTQQGFADMRTKWLKTFGISE